MELTPPRFGALLREFRLAAGLSQEALAERATMSVDGIGALERGTNQAPQRETLALLVKALGLTEEQRAAIEAAAVRPSRGRRRAQPPDRRHNMPAPSTPIYGREPEIEAVKSLLETSPVVVLTGAGGVGKTRLALAIGERMLSDFADGVWFVDLAPIGDPKLVPSAAALPFGISDSADRPLTETLTHVLRRKHLLLIVDNCEHVVQAAATFIHALIRDCPGIRVLSTSRQSMSLPGGRIYRVSSLQVEPAIALFEEHAKRSSEAFSLGNGNRETAARIVQRLDGIALAIELAAARLRLLSLEQIEERLSERFRILSAGSFVSLPRQQTMRAAIDWSYDLLANEEKQLFASLAVFSGGFTLDAAGSVCAGENIDQWRVFEVLASLVDKSLVISEPAVSEQRYRLLETVREYAREKAFERPELFIAARRHAEYFTGLAERAQTSFPSSPSAVTWAGALDPELENFRAALDWALVAGADPELGARLLTSLQEYWILQGHAPEALRYAQKALPSGETLPRALHAALWLTLARMQQEYFMTPQALLEAAEGACKLYEELGDARELAMALRERGIARMHLGVLDEAENDLQRSLAIYRELGDLRMVARALGSLGGLRQFQGVFEDARSIMLEVLQLSIDIGDDRGATVMSMNVAETEFALGDADAAIARARENLLNDPILLRKSDLRATQQSNLAAYLFAKGADEEARVMALAAMRDADYYYSAVPIQHLAALTAHTDPKRAARLLGYVEKVLGTAGFTRERTEQYTHERLLATLRDTIGEDEIARLGTEGAALTEEQAVKLARRRVQHPDSRTEPASMK